MTKEGRFEMSGRTEEGNQVAGGGEGISLKKETVKESDTGPQEGEELGEQELGKASGGLLLTALVYSSSGSFSPDDARSVGLGPKGPIPGPPITRGAASISELLGRHPLLVSRIHGSSQRGGAAWRPDGCRIAPA